MSNISISIVGMLYNLQLLKYIGEDGVAAYGVLMYLGSIFSSIVIGYSVGAAPVISYHFGSSNTEELKNLKKRCFVIVSGFSVTMYVAALALAAPLSMMFVGYDRALLTLTVDAFFIYSLSFLLFGFTVFASAFFTALNNGPVSAAISFLRTMVFQAAGILLLPLVFDMDGIWWSAVVAEALSLCASLAFLKAFQKKYMY